MSNYICRGENQVYDYFFDAVSSGDVDRVRKSFDSRIQLDTLLKDDPDDDGRAALHMASSAGHVEIVKFLLTAGASVNEREINVGVPYPPNTPLFNACYFNYVAVVRILLENGADIQAVGEMDCNPVHLILGRSLDFKKTVTAQQFELLELFFAFGQDANALATDVGGTLLHQAVELGNPQLIQMLLKHGAELNRIHPDYPSSVLSQAVSMQSFEMVKYLLQCGAIVDESALLAAKTVEMFDLLCCNADHDLVKNCPALHSAASGSSPKRDLVTYLLHFPVNLEAVNRNGDTALLSMCSSGHTLLDMVNLLIYHGANRFARRITTKGDNQSAGDTVLHRAAICSRPQTIEFLLASGVNPNAVNDLGQTPLIIFALNIGRCNQTYSGEGGEEVDGKLQALQKLKDAGADASICDYKSRTPLHALAMTHWAIKLPRRMATAEMLLQMGANPYAVDAEGKTVRDIFAKVADWEMVEFLSNLSFAKERLLPKL